MKNATVAVSLTMALLVASPALARPKPIKPVMAFVQQNRAALEQAARSGGGMLELHRGATHRLLLTASGGLAYQRLNRPRATVHKVRLNLFFPHAKFPTLDGDRAVARLREMIGRATPKGGGQQTTDNQRRAAPPRLQAILPNGSKVAPSNHIGGYHGTNAIQPGAALKHGLPAKGSDWRLREHSEEAGNSAFRGTTAVVSEPLTGNGAAYWAGEGGWVYEIRKVPSWDVNTLLEGRVRTPGGFRGNIMHAENEIAIPAKVEPQQIKAYGKVVADSNGRLKVQDWIHNPAFRP